MRRILLVLMLCPLLASSQWTKVGSTLNTVITNAGYMGQSVSMSADGSVIAVGVPGFDAGGGPPTNIGEVLIFQDVGGTWTVIGQPIVGESNGDASGGSTGNNRDFVTAVSLNDDGTIVAIGAETNDGNGLESGHVRVYENVGNVWTQIGADIDGAVASDRCGFSVDMNADGSIVVIGSYRFNGGTGQVRVFENVNGMWTQMGGDIDGENFGDQFGFTVSLSDIGTTVAVGAPSNAGNGQRSGHVRVYDFTTGIGSRGMPGNWNQVGVDIDGEAAFDESGSAISLSGDGDVVAIGAYLNDGVVPDTGHVRVYQRMINSWIKIGGDIDGVVVNNGHFGTSVSISFDGSIVAAGAPNFNGNGAGSGHVRVFQNVSNIWTQINSDIVGAGPLDQLGQAVDLNADGSRIVVGIPQQTFGLPNQGVVEVYENATLSTSDLEVNTDILVYPNPSKDHFIIESPMPINEVQIFNVQGQKVKTFTSPQDKYTIDELQSGAYFVNVMSEDKNTLVKLIKE
ncbi:MAG: T9SS type A sorting domain-containing protein [Bacteroidota bacterium]